MVRWVQSPGLGLVRVHDTPHPPGLAPWLPPFHVDEIRLLSHKVVTLDDWRGIVDVKAVFPGAYVTEIRDIAAEQRRWQRKMGRSRLYAPARPVPAEDE